MIGDRYLAVVIDFPQTKAGSQLVLDRRQNDALAREYGITEIAMLPVMVVADAEDGPSASSATGPPASSRWAAS